MLCGIISTVEFDVYNFKLDSFNPIDGEKNRRCLSVRQACEVRLSSARDLWATMIA